MYDIKELPLKNSILKEYPELSDIFFGMDAQLGSFDELTADQVLRYIILTYHFDSPLVQSKADLMWRKKQAMMLSGVTANSDGFFCKEAMEVIANRHAGAIDLKMRFIRFENNLDWVELSALMEVYYDYIRTITDESQSTGNKTASDIFKNKQSIIKESKTLKNEIDLISNRVFRGDVDLQNYVGSTIVKEERRLRISPEVNAEVKKQKSDE